MEAVRQNESKKSLPLHVAVASGGGGLFAYAVNLGNQFLTSPPAERLHQVQYHLRGFLPSWALWSAFALVAWLAVRKWDSRTLALASLVSLLSMTARRTYAVAVPPESRPDLPIFSFIFYDLPLTLLSACVTAWLERALARWTENS